ncbi:MAG: hypothetical protein K9I36_07510 [Bacteroidia bacterium]|nr:hypothetical protein [Bacteroidia bacterium]
MMKYRILGIVLIYFFLIGVKQDYNEIIVKNEGKLVHVVIEGKHTGLDLQSKLFN